MSSPGDVEQAYRVQRAKVDRGLAGGGRQIGWKLGFTSPGALARLGLTEPLVGVIVDEAVLRTGALLRRADFASPKIEAEIALVLGCDVSAREAAADPAAVVASAHAAIEVVDPAPAVGGPNAARIVADNIGFARAVVGEAIPVELAALADLSAEVLLDGESRGVGHATEVYGGPLAAFTWLARFLSARDGCFRAGDVVLTGAFLPAIEVAHGRCEVVFGDTWRAAVVMS